MSAISFWGVAVAFKFHCLYLVVKVVAWLQKERRQETELYKNIRRIIFRITSLFEWHEWAKLMRPNNLVMGVNLLFPWLDILGQKYSEAYYMVYQDYSLVQILMWMKKKLYLYFCYFAVEAILCYFFFLLYIASWCHVFFIKT